MRENNEHLELLFGYVRISLPHQENQVEKKNVFYNFRYFILKFNFNTNIKIFGSFALYHELK